MSWEGFPFFNFLEEFSCGIKILSFLNIVLWKDRLYLQNALLVRLMVFALKSTLLVIRSAAPSSSRVRVVCCVFSFLLFQATARLDSQRAGGSMQPRVSSFSRLPISAFYWCWSWVLDAPHSWFCGRNLPCEFSHPAIYYLWTFSILLTSFGFI
jgi:hypothetical protein